MRLVELLKKISLKELTAMHLMALLQALPELDDTYTPMLKQGHKEARRQSEAAAGYGDTVVRLLQSYAPDHIDYYARCKRAAILSDWVQGIPIEEIEGRFTTTQFRGKIGYGDIRKFADATRFHLRSAYQIISVMFLGEGPSVESVEALLKQLEVGIPEGSLGLLTIPIPLERGEYLALYQAGARTLEDLWSLSDESIESILGPSRSAQMALHRPPSSA